MPKTYGLVELQLHAFLISALGTGVVSFASRFQYPLDRMFDALRTKADAAFSVCTGYPHDAHNLNK